MSLKAPSAQTRLPVLAIEDSLGDLRLIELALEKPSSVSSGFTLIKATRLEEGLQLLASESYAAVLLDLNLPDSNGLDTLSSVRKARSDIPIVILSNEASEETAVEAVRQGAQEYLFKEDISTRMLTLALHNAIQRADAQKGMSLQREWFFRILEGISDALVIVDDTLRVDFSNRAARDLLSTSVKAILKRLFPSGAPEEGKWEIDFHPKTGEIRILEVKSERIDLGRFGSDFFGVNFYDVTRHKQVQIALEAAKNEAQNASQLKSEFIAHVSHELRTPLNGVIGMSSLLLENKPRPDQIECLRTVRNSSELLLNIISDILDLSKIESGKLDLTESEFSLPTLLEQSVELFGLAALEKGVVLGAIIDPNARNIVLGDPTRVQQIIVNLTGNALKFTSSGHVHVKLELTSKNNFRFSIIDTGVGIKEPDQIRLFEPFSQANNQQVSNVSGTGLGLAISKKLVSMMSGKIGLESTWGEGSKFWFELPLKKIKEEELLIPDDKKKLIWIETSNPHLHELLELQLVSVGFEVSKMFTPDVSLVILDEVFSNFPTSQIRQFGKVATAILSSELTESENGFSKVIWPYTLDRLVESLQTISAGKNTVITAVKEDTKVKNTAQKFSSDLPVLVVDDNAVNRQVASMMLAHMGLESVEATGGQEALDALAKQKVCLILLDCLMPEMDGFDTTLAIKKNGPHFNKAPIVALTASALLETVRKCEEVGMDAYLTKPVKLEKLAEILGRFLSSKQSEKKEELDVLVVNPNDLLDAPTVETLTKLKNPKTQEPILREILKTYSDTSPEIIVQIKKFAESNDLNLLYKTAHRLKGASGNVGAKALADLCLEVEQSAKREEPKNYQELAKKIEETYELSMQAFQKFI